MGELEIDRLASKINFLREWRYFKYEPRVVCFAPEIGNSSGKEGQNEITLSQFSAAEVPKCNMEAEQGPSSAQCRKDFILYAGGLVWALDWCPRGEQGTISDTTSEFIAVSAHPPDSAYHKLGEPLKSRGMVQIWRLRNYTTNEDTQRSVESTKKKCKKTALPKNVDNTTMRPRGRPRKNPIITTPAIDPETQFIPEEASNAPHADNMQPQINALEKEQIIYRRKRKSRGSSLDEAPVELFESQFVPPLAVRLPDASDVFSVDEILHSNPFPMKENLKKQKSVNGENRVMDETTGIPDDERPLLALTYPESMTKFSPLGGELTSSYTSDLGKRRKKPTKRFLESGLDITIAAEKLTSPCTSDVGVRGEKTTKTVLESDLEFTSEVGELTSSETSDLGESRKKPTKKVLESDLDCTISDFKMKSRKKSKCLKGPRFSKSGPSTLNRCKVSSLARHKEKVSQNDGVIPQEHVAGSCPAVLSSGGSHGEENNILPEAVLCLGHDGKVAWDVKWRPTRGESVNTYIMGYLAVVLGDGAIEVWEVPSLDIVSRIYASRQSKDTDPRFAKLDPVFRSSKLKIGDRQSMPLTVEWSASPPHDLLLAGCHDGVVAVWKFCAQDQPEDARPLLCFSAETSPIRALMWAPFDGDLESLNVFATAGHGGLKFWDLRDPYRPLWDVDPSQRYIFSLDWLPDPRCVLVTYDDGNLKMLSLLRSAYDVPVTGEPFSGTLYQGLHSHKCSSHAIWSVHASRVTGTVAYCCADGAVLYFQLTHKAVGKDPTRNRPPHFLCGSLGSEGSTVTVNTELPSCPHPMKKSATEWADTPRSARTVASSSNYGKRVKKGAVKIPNQDEEVLALEYDDDPENEEANDTKNSAKSGNAKKTTSTDKNNVKNREQCEVEDSLPKMQAMHRVRWNINKGSERWLCYGGAAGIVRCQEIVIPEFNKKLLKR